jgi:hypothetical protein
MEFSFLIGVIIFYLPLDHRVRRPPLLFKVANVCYVTKYVTERNAIEEFDGPL